MRVRTCQIPRIRTENPDVNFVNQQNVLKQERAHAGLREKQEKITTNAA